MLKFIALIFITLLLSCFLFNPEDKPVTESYHYIHDRSEIIGEWVFFYSYLQEKNFSDCFNLDPYLEEDKIVIDSMHVLWRFLNVGNCLSYSFPYKLCPTILDTTAAFFCMDTVLWVNTPNHHFGGILGKKTINPTFIYYEYVEIKRLHDTLEFFGEFNPYSYEIARYVLKKW
jgi:hypothetical protein